MDVLAISTGLSQFLILAGAGIVGAVILGIGRAGMGLMKTRQTQTRQDEFDQRTLTEFFFDTPRDSRTGAPAKIGWTTKVDGQLDRLSKSQTETQRVLNEILYEVKPNGGGNLRGAVDRVADRHDREEEDRE